MMVDKKGHKCRNIQEQVGKNTCDIKELKERTPVTDFVINATKSEDETTLHVKQRVDSEVQEFDFKGGKKVVAGINIGVQETADSYIISASTEPVGSVNWGGIGGDIADQEDLSSILNNKFTLNFSGQGGNETNGWFRTTHQSGVQVKSLLTNTAAWLLSDRIRYYPTSSSTPYYDFYFPEESGTLALEFSTTRDLTLDNHVLGLSLSFTGRIDELEDNYEYLYQTKQDHDSLEADVEALGFLKGSDRFINSLKVENHTLKWTYDDGVTGNTYIPYKTSDLQNDSGFITSSDIPPIPTKTSDLQNDSGFITSSDIPPIPTKTSDLTNDSNFAEVVANPQGEATGVMTKMGINGVVYSIEGGGGGGSVDNVLQNGVSVVVDGIAYVVTPTKTSDLTNDSGFITATDIPTPSWSDVTDKPFNSIGTGLRLDETALTFDPAVIASVEYTENRLNEKQNISTLDTDIQALGFIKGISMSDIADVLEGSQFISVDEDTETEKLQISFDFTDLPEFIEFADNQEIVASWTDDDKPLLQLNLKQELSNKIARALVTPLTHTEETLVGVDTTGAQEQIKIGSGLGVIAGALGVDAKTIFDICNPVGSIKSFDRETDMTQLSNGTWELLPDDTFIATKGITEAGQVGGSNDAVVVKHTHNTNSTSKDLNGTIASAWNTNSDDYFYSSGIFGKVSTTARKGLNGSSFRNEGGEYWLDAQHSHGTDEGSNSVEGTNKNMPKYLATYTYKRTA